MLFKIFCTAMMKVALERFRLDANVTTDMVRDWCAQEWGGSQTLSLDKTMAVIAMVDARRSDSPCKRPRRRSCICGRRGPPK